MPEFNFRCNKCNEQKSLNHELFYDEMEESDGKFLKCWCGGTFDMILQALDPRPFMEGSDE